MSIWFGPPIDTTGQLPYGDHTGPHRRRAEYTRNEVRKMSYLCGKSCYDSECAECAVVSDALEERGVVPDHDLLTALVYNPQPWSLVDLAEIALEIDDGNDEPQFTWIVRLMDGRWAAVRGWHDYTGWDCQSGLRTEWYATKDDALRTLVDWERAAAGMPT